MALSVGELVAFLKLDTADFDNAMRRVQGSAGQAGQAVNRGLGQGAAGANQLTGAAGQAAAGTTQIGTNAGLASKALGAMGGILAGSALVDYISSAVTASSDLNETISKSQQIFGDAAGSVEEWGNTAATAVGLSKGDALAAAANFGNMFTQIGYTSQAAADLSTKVVQMSADLGSFNNLPTADVADKISGAFNGEYDSIQALVPGLNAARVESEALAATGKTSADQLTQQEKVTATLAIITKDGAKAMGDFARTSDGFANQSKITAATIEDQKAALGDKLMPVVQQLMQLFNDVGIPALDLFGTALGSLAEMIQPLLGLLGEGVELFGSLPAPVQVAVGALTAIVLLRGPLNTLWTSIQAGAAAARTSMATAAAGATGMGAAAAVGAAGVRTLGTAMKTAFLSNPIGIALVGITTAMSLFSGGAEEATVSTTDFSSAVDELNGEVDAVKLTDLIPPETLVAMQKAGIATGDYTAALAGNVDAQDRVRAQLEANIAAQEGNLAGTVQAQAALKRYDTDLQSVATSQANVAATTAEAGAATEGTGDASEKAAGSLEKQATATYKVKDASVEASTSVKAQEQANKDLETAIRNVISALDDQQHRNDPTSQYAAEAAIRDTVAAMRDGAAATRDIDQANSDYQQSVADVATAEAELKKAQEDSSSSSELLAEKQRAVDDAHRGVADAADAVRDAEDKAAGSSAKLYESGEKTRESFVQLATEAYNSAAATGTQADAQAAASGTITNLTTDLYNQMIQSGKTDAEARAYIDSLGLIPDQVATNIALNGGDQANADLDAIKRKFTDLNGKTSTMYVRTVETNSAATNAQGVVATRATGGAIYGPGSGTSDSIPARLSNGEHVVTDQEVRAAGGQGAMYAIRRAMLAGTLSGYAGGGAVSLKSASTAPVRVAAYAAGGAVMGSAAPMSTTLSPSFEVHVHVGEREIEDIVAVQIRQTNIPPEKLARAQREAERTASY